MPCNLNEEGIRYNTSYYRRNKKERFCVNTCPHCEYESTGPKSAMQSHIWSKHTPEDQRPFQCPHNECNRGYAAKATLHKHILKSHKISMPKKKVKGILVYEIKVKDTFDYNQLPSKYRKRIIIYKNNNYIRFDKFESLPISFNDLYFDRELGYISLIEYTRNDLLERFKLSN